MATIVYSVLQCGRFAYAVISLSRQAHGFLFRRFQRSALLSHKSISDCYFMLSQCRSHIRAKHFSSYRKQNCDSLLSCMSSYLKIKLSEVLTHLNCINAMDSIFFSLFFFSFLLTFICRTTCCQNGPCA